MNINSTSTAQVAALAQQLFKSVDSNNDGKLNANEFQSFLQNLVGLAASKSGGLGSGSTSRLLDDGGADTPAPAETGRVYYSMAGFDTTKLNTPSHTTPKYVFARATQDLDLGSDRATRSGNLQKIADYAKTHGYPNTVVVSDDTMDFGDGYGVIDVLTSDGQWWWYPKA